MLNRDIRHINKTKNFVGLKTNNFILQGQKPKLNIKIGIENNPSLSFFNTVCPTTTTTTKFFKIINQEPKSYYFTIIL
jgi:hypothetical protein